MFVYSPRTPVTDHQELRDVWMLPSAEPENGFKQPTATAAASRLSVAGGHVGRSSHEGAHRSRSSHRRGYSHDACSRCLMREHAGLIIIKTAMVFASRRSRSRRL